MDLDRVKGQLEGILKADITVKKLTHEQWSKAAALEGQPAKSCKSVKSDGQVLFAAEPGGSGGMLVFAVDNRELSEPVQRLIELVLESFRSPEKQRPASPASEEESRARLVSDWVYGRLEAGDTNAEMPEALISLPGFRQTKIPILLYGEYSGTLTVHYSELRRLLESFFGADVVVLPLLEREWLILGSETLLEESTGDDRESVGETGQLQEALVSICHGLYEMLSNEWVGECHLSISYPIKPAKELVRTITLLRESIMLGRTFDVVQNMHYPWKLQLEKLLHAVPDAERQAFVDRVLRGADHVLDAEMLSTLEHFFLLDCNVSETAKQLYIHRNTLLYRLDKFKNETGYDVRAFGDAVLVKVALLLYKVTKRK